MGRRSDEDDGEDGGAYRDDDDDVERSDVIIQGVDAFWGFKLLLPSPMTTSWVGSQRRRWNDERRVQLWLFNKHFHFVTFLVSRELDIIHCFIAMSSKVGGKIREGGGVSFRSGPIFSATAVITVKRCVHDITCTLMYICRYRYRITLKRTYTWYSK